MRDAVEGMPLTCRPMCRAAKRYAAHANRSDRGAGCPGRRPCRRCRRRSPRSRFPGWPLCRAAAGCRARTGARRSRRFGHFGHPSFSSKFGYVPRFKPRHFGHFGQGGLVLKFGEGDFVLRFGHVPQQAGFTNRPRWRAARRRAARNPPQTNASKWPFNMCQSFCAAGIPEDGSVRPPQPHATACSSDSYGHYHMLIYYNRVDKGGHFAAWEQPELFSAELRAASRSLR